MSIDETVVGHSERSEIQDIYLADHRPWVIGYSGGKDSTAVVRLVFEALRGLPLEKRNKPVFVVSSDTLVETPVVVELIGETLARIQQGAVSAELPITVAQVTPDQSETFWVNLIGRGYPAPTRQFRWCTERMKIDPVSEFIKEKVARFGEVTIVLGSRTEESASRAQIMKRHRIEGRRLSRHTTLASAFVYTPIEAWSADNVWEFLFSGPAPWGGDHQRLFDLYKDSNAGECPLVIDKSTPSCGNSRFGCWVCTVVSQDRAIDGLIQSGHTWMVPLKDFRNQLYETTLPKNKHAVRHERRRDGRITVVIDDKGNEKHVPGAYKMSVRQEFLRKLLNTQKTINESNPPAPVVLISKEELEQIRNQWRNDPNEPDWQDSVPRIYAETLGQAADWQHRDDALFGSEEARLLADLSRADRLPGELAMKLIEFEISMDGLSKRSQIFAKLGELLSRDWGDAGPAIDRRIQEGSRIRDRDEQEEKLLDRYRNFERMLADDS